ncbi:MAG: hypothetical protein U0W40_17285 [Acidimicrobiia bacterium]
MAQHLHVVVDLLDRAHRGEVEPAGEHRGGVEQRPLVVVEELVRPLDRVVQRVLTLGGAGRATQQTKPVGEPVAHVFGAHRGHAGGGELDAEGQPVERGADVGDRGRGRRVADPEVGTGGLGPLGEQRDRLRVGAALEPERADAVWRLTRRPERLAAGGQHAAGTAGAQQRLDGGDRARQHVLAVVEHEQHPAAGQRVDERGEEGQVAAWRDTEERGHRGGYRPVVGHARKIDHPHAVGELACDLGPHLEREAGLAHAAHPVEGDERSAAHQVGDGSDVGLPAHE